MYVIPCSDTLFSAWLRASSVEVVLRTGFGRLWKAFAVASLPEAVNSLVVLALALSAVQLAGIFNAFEASWWRAICCCESNGVFIYLQQRNMGGWSTHFAAWEETTAFKLTRSSKGFY